MKKFLAALILITGSGISLLPADLIAAKIEASKTGSKINISIDGKFFTSYIFSDDEKYPFFFPLNGPSSGGSITSMRNAEYPHHSSLFFGCDMVNGGNYWQENLERGRIASLNAIIEKEGRDTAVISDECIWTRPSAASPVRDFRKFIITCPAAGIYLIDAEITMEMLADVTILKTNHSLFSARIAPDLSVKNGGTMINADGDSGEKETFGKNSPWMDYYGKRDEVTEGIAILQHPSNPWFPSPWFTRDYGFFSPTPFFWPPNGKDMTFSRGSAITLKYRIIIHIGTTGDADIAGQFEKYKNGE